MPIIKSAAKRARQSVKRTANNRQIKTAIKSAVKAFVADPSQKTLSAAQSELDKAVKKRLAQEKHR